MKKLVALFVVAVALAFVAQASAAPSMGSVSLPPQANPQTLMTGTTFGVDAPPITSIPGSGGPSWQESLDISEGTFYVAPGPTSGPLELYTIACWDPMFDVIGPSAAWECGYFHSNPFGPNASENSVAAQFAVGSIGTTNYNLCSWLLPWDGNVCGAYDSASVAGINSPAQSGNLIPNLDQYVGKTVNLYADENWCSALAPPNYDAIHNWQNLELTGCYGNGSTVGIGLSARTLAASDGPPVVQKVTLAVQAGPNDCHVPKVKGLTLRKAKLRLFAHHCRASVRYVKGRVAGRVRYQPLAVGTGRPRGFRVKLVVALKG